jgi:hypothetical protein
MKDCSDDNSIKQSKKFLDDVISSYYECNPNKKRTVFEKRPKCFYCDIKDAVWENSILEEYCCNDCVPRGCSCRLFKIKKNKRFSIENYYYSKNSFGEELPCEDWHIF